jgi:hypothetical protein
MSKGSLNDAVRAAGYAMATSEELLGLPTQVVIVGHPDARVREQTQRARQAAERSTQTAEPRSLRTFFGSWAVWA